MHFLHTHFLHSLPAPIIRFIVSGSHEISSSLSLIAISGSPWSEVGAASPGWLQLKVIKTNNVAKVRNEAVVIVDFLPECEGVNNLSVGGSMTPRIGFFGEGANSGAPGATSVTPGATSGAPGVLLSASVVDCRHNNFLN